MTERYWSVFESLSARFRLALIAFAGLNLLWGCAAKQESMQVPPPGAPPQQMGYPGGAPPQVGIPAAGLPPQEPVMEQVAQRVIQHYQTSSCQTLARERSQPPSGQRAEMERRAMQVLRDDPQLRMQFLTRVAAPIANKLFECDLIP